MYIYVFVNIYILCVYAYMYIYVYATYITGLWAPTVSMYIVGACVCVCVRHDTHTSCVPPIRTGLRALVCVRETHTLCM